MYFLCKHPTVNMAYFHVVRCVLFAILHVSLCSLAFKEQLPYSVKLGHYFSIQRKGICYQNRQWFLRKSVGSWNFNQEQLVISHFPIDNETRNYVRQVRNAVFSAVEPMPLLAGPRLAIYSEDVLSDLLDMDPVIATADGFLNFVSGNEVLEGSRPIAHRYGGHQFGYWSGQLGDGRAVMLGEYVSSSGRRWELQLKGSGLTPYSRQGDGRAVIRSSVREFLCSEAMHALGIPTSRAASLVASNDPVIRDQFYNGNMKQERAAVVLRLAESWFRIGSLEILAFNNEIDLLRKLVDFIIVHYFPAINSSNSDRYLEFFQEVCFETAKMIALWQSVGFTHGVCNTDNFSILSITIDYGPFGFMEAYDPSFVPNTSDDEGRYRYEAQPDVGMFNLEKLRLALKPLLSKKQVKLSKVILKGYTEQYKLQFMELFLKKVGLSRKQLLNEEDEQLVAVLLKVMEDTKADFTMTFRELSEISSSDLIEAAASGKLSGKFWTLDKLLNHEWFPKWIKLYIDRVSKESITDIDRQVIMQNTNPRYVLRNWIAQAAIGRAENNDFKLLKEVHQILEHPFTYSAIAEKYGFASQAPSWAKHLKVSCSS